MTEKWIKTVLKYREEVKEFIDKEETLMMNWKEEEKKKKLMKKEMEKKKKEILSLHKGHQLIKTGKEQISTPADKGNVEDPSMFKGQNLEELQCHLQSHSLFNLADRDIILTLNKMLCNLNSYKLENI
jgi:phage terminase small subunit